MGHDTIGLMHPTCNWYNRKILRGHKIEILKISECLNPPGWYYGQVRLIDPSTNEFDCIDNRLHIFAFRPRRVK